MNLCGYKPPSLDTISGLISGEAATISTHGGAEPPSDIISSGAAGPSDRALSSDRGSVDDGHSSFEKGTDSFEDSCSAAARMTREKNTTPQLSSIGSIGAVGSSVSHSRPDASPSWLNFRVYGTRSTKVSSSSELREAWDWGAVTITTTEGNAAEYDKVLRMIESEKLPKIVDLKKADYECLVSSPRRFLNNCRQTRNRIK